MSEKVKQSQIKGVIRLFKNDRVIREKSFFRKYDRQRHLKEFNEVAKIGTDDSYYITIQLNI